MYSPEDKEAVRRATDLLALVGSETTVRRAGSKTTAICPFHEERTPSFSIDAARGLYHCFGCGKGGDIFSFVMETQGLTFREALEALAQQAGITLTPDPRAAERAGERSQLLTVMHAAVDLYWRWLKKSEQAGSARAYLRERGFDGSVVDTFKIGYAPSDGGGNRLFKELSAQGYDQETIGKVGLLAPGRERGRARDYFRDQILFPIFDMRGDPVGFGGRAMTENMPKYINTRETSLYRKSELLYGLDLAKREIKDQDYALVVEGYTDVIALHQQGLRQAVATCGTALGERHFDLLRRFSGRVVLLFDADSAGTKAVLRVEELNTPKTLELDIRVAIIPSGTDPAEMCQTGRIAELELAVEQAQPLGEFLIDQLLTPYQEQEINSYVQNEALRTVIPALYQLQNAQLVLDELIRKVSGVIRIPTRTIKEQVQSYRPPASLRSTTNDPPISEPPPDEEDDTDFSDDQTVSEKQYSLGGLTSPERELIRVLVFNGSHPRGNGMTQSRLDLDLRTLEISETIFAHPLVKAAWSWISETRSQADYGTPLSLDGDDTALMDILRQWTFDSRPLENPQELILRLQHDRLSEEISSLEAQRSELEEQGETETTKYRQVVSQIMDLNRERLPPDDEE